MSRSAEPLLQRAYDLGSAKTANALWEIEMLRGDFEATTRLWVEGNLGLDFNMTRDALLALHRGVFGDAAAKQAGAKAVQEPLIKMGKKRALPTTPLYLFRFDQPKLGL